ncbi:AaceriADL136Cp [[Ashbya] aceris (nom. inval.)]|nr:AaceriADL136Cp [[Ashbya] aceris (nom. inval.)]
MKEDDRAKALESVVIGSKKRRSVLGEFLARKYERILEAEEKVAEQGAVRRGISNRELVTNIACSLFDATWERLRTGKDQQRKTIDDDFDEFALRHELESSADSFWQEDASDNGTGVSDDEEETEERRAAKQRVVSQAQEQEHFIDILLDKMISAVLPEDLPEREQFTQRVQEPGRRRSHPISLIIMSRNLKIMTTKLGLIFEFQDSLIRLVTWRNPSGTALSLILFSFICFNPMLVIILPMLYVLFGLMIPGYLHRHPLRRNFYLTKHSYGKSLLETVATGGKPASWQSHDDVQEFDYNNLHPDAEEWERALHIKQTMEFIVNLRDLQNLMTASVKGIESAEKFVYGDAGFKNEHHSTVLFLSGLLVVTGLWVVAPYINWSLISAVGAWTALILIHPRVLPIVTAYINDDQLEKGKVVIENVERYDILLDEKPEERFLELFEIYKQRLTSNEWDFYLLSSYAFDPTDKYRKSQRPPPGVISLDEVVPPSTWSFDRNSAWEVDYDVKGWAQERGLSLEIDGEFLVDDSFKRRRLTRKVVRYANPARKPAV